MAKIDKTYHDLLLDILHNGYQYEDPNRKSKIRTQIQSHTLVHNFKDGFPAITTKELYWKGIVGELLWMLRGETNIKYLVDNNINIWNKDAYNWYVKHFKIKHPSFLQNMLTYQEFVSRIKKSKTLEDRRNYQNIGITLGNIGRGYGAQLRNWQGFNKENSVYGINIDQLAELIHTLKTNPMATKKTITFWNPSEKDDCALTPCHWSFEILVKPLSWNERLASIDEYFGNLSETINMKDFNNAQQSNNRIEELNKVADKYNIPKYSFILKWHQHSVDTFLGLPFNIASYALLAHIIGKMTNMIPEGIIGDLSNVHIYNNHLDAVKKQLKRDPDKHGKSELNMHGMRTSNINDNINDLLKTVDIDKFTLDNYQSYPRIKAEMLPYSK